MICPKCKKEEYYEPHKKKWNKKKGQLDVTCCRCGYKATDVEFSPPPLPIPECVEITLHGKVYLITEKSGG